MPERMRLPQAGVRDTAAYVSEVLAPNVAKGVIIRRPAVVGMAQRMGLDRRAVRRLQHMRDKYGRGPVHIPLPLRPQAVILAPEHAHRVLDNTPEPFAAAETMKKAALKHFEPKMVLISHGAERAERRRINEEVLQSACPVHSLAEPFLRVVDEEAAALSARVERQSVLDWDAYIGAWYRVVRRVVLGDSARDDHELTHMLGDLRAHANWAFARPIDTRLRERFLRRLRTHLERAESGSLAEVLAHIPKNEHSAALMQVPQYLFAFDPAGMASFRALALIAAHPEQAERAQAEIRERGAGDLPFLRACVLESLRLWPTTPVVLRETTTETEWENGVMPAGTTVIIVAPYFHRDDRNLEYADRFAPDIWLRERTEQDWPLIPFSGGPAYCPARNLVLMLTSNMLAALLKDKDIQQEPNVFLDARRALPATLDNYSLSFTLRPR